MTSFKTLPLNELRDPNRSISYGIVQPGRPTAGGVPIVRVNNFSDNSLDLSNVLRVEPTIEAQYRRSRPKAGDVLLTLVGSIGQVAIARPDIEGWNLARAVGLIPTADEHHSRWIALCLRAPDAQAFIQRNANTTVQATFNLKDLALLPIPYPAKDVREGILSALTPLDDKIELNWRMGETLEAMAQAIFRDWFVDFGPVRRKLAGETDLVAVMGGLTPNSARAAEFAAVFPAALTEDGAPQGWASATLADLATHCKGTVVPFAHSDLEFEHYSLPAFDCGQEPAIDLGDSIKSNKTPVPAGAVLLSKLNPETPRVWLPNDPTGWQQIASTEFLIFQPAPRVGRGLLYCLFRDPTVRQILAGMVTGTSKSHQRISPPALMKTSLLIGSGEAFEAFEQIVEPLLQRVLSLRAENRTLAETRDYLLPRLMSGAVRVGEIADQEAAA